MWNVKGKTVSGKDVQYQVPVGKDTDKAFVMALAFQEHGKASPDDALTAETEVVWTSDNVTQLPQRVNLYNRANFAIDKRVAKGVWKRFSERAYRGEEAANDALESAASEYPNDVFRIVATVTYAQVISVSRNGTTFVGETPDKPKEDVKTPPAPGTEPKEEPKGDGPKEEPKGDGPKEEPKPSRTRRPATTTAA